MDLLDYVRVLRRGWAVVLAFIIVGLAAGIAITVTTTKVYEATFEVYVNVNSTGTQSSFQDTSTALQQQIQSIKALATGTTVAGDVKADVGTSYTVSDIQSKLSASAPLNTNLIYISATDTNPHLAARLANSAEAHFQDLVTRSLKSSDGQSLVTVVSVNPATVPSAPIKPNKVLNIGLGFVVGLLLGVGIVILRDVLDNTIKGPSDFEALDVPVLGLVPLDKRASKTPIAFRGDPHSARSESYRQLRTNMQFVNVDETPRVIAVTSAIPGEGKTTTAMNLAAALADAGSRVVLVEADLRRPTIASSLGLSPDVGFTTVLIGQATIEDALQNAGRNLAVLTCGPIPPNPSELLVSDQAKSLIRSLSDHADFVVVDTAPLLPVADGSEVAAIADATLVVHRSGKTTREQAARSVEALAKVGERPVGVVLNMITKAQGKYDYQYAYTYTYRPNKSRAAEKATPEEHVSSLPEEPPVGDEVSIDEIVTSDPELLEPPVADDAAAHEPGDEHPVGGRRWGRPQR